MRIFFSIEVGNSFVVKMAPSKYLSLAACCPAFEVLFRCEFALSRKYFSSEINLVR